MKHEMIYPKTYEECIDELDTHKVVVICAWKKEMKALQTLLVCLDAYWKIAGEEMGLGEPWKPDWNDKKQDKHGFYNEIKHTIISSTLFVFPTAKMRDVFYENFKDLIEECKVFRS